MRRVVARRLARVAHETAQGFAWAGRKWVTEAFRTRDGVKRYPEGTERRTYQDMKQAHRDMKSGKGTRRTPRVKRHKGRGFYALPGQWGRR